MHWRLALLIYVLSMVLLLGAAGGGKLLSHYSFSSGQQWGILALLVVGIVLVSERSYAYRLFKTPLISAGFLLLCSFLTLRFFLVVEGILTAMFGLIDLILLFFAVAGGIAFEDNFQTWQNGQKR